jgi:beta-lactam-binding protein with PASTA domain
VEYIKAFFREVGQFFSSSFFLFNFVKMAAVVIGLFFLTTWWLKCYTNHGESVQVADYKGMNINDAKELGSEKGFRLEVLDSIWMDGQPGDIIISQNPQPFMRVKEGRKVYVTVTSSNPEMVVLPILSESSYDFEKYSSKLMRRSIKCRISERVFDAKQAENTILYLVYNGSRISERDIKDGFEVPMGSTIDFVITERLSNELEIPDLVCLKFDVAEFVISSSNLNLGNVILDETVTNQATAYIYMQEPAYAPGTTMRVGEQINIWLTQYKPETCPLDEGF